jgi:zinc transport system permease protein
MMEEFFIRALMAGLCVALAAGPSGSFVLWLRMAPFGSAMSHAALFGACIAMAIQVLPFYGVLIAAIIVAAAVLGFDRASERLGEMVTRALAYGLLASGIIAAAMLPRSGFDVMGFLFGNVLTMSWTEVILTGSTALGVMATLMAVWRPMLRISVSPDLAAVEGLNVRRYQLAFTVALAGLVAVAMQVVGALLVMALLIIPAISARPFASTPERMALYAALFGAGAVLSGLSASLWQDVPAGPAIAVSAALLFIISLIRRSFGTHGSRHVVQAQG